MRTAVELGARLRPVVSRASLSWAHHRAQLDSSRRVPDPFTAQATDEVIVVDTGRIYARLFASWLEQTR